MSYNFYFWSHRGKFEKFSDAGNAAANAALQMPEPPTEFKWTHHWQNPHKYQWEQTVYTVDFHEMQQTQLKDDGGCGTCRCIKGWWSEAPYGEFDYDGFVAPHGPPAQPAPASCPWVGGTPTAPGTSSTAPNAGS